MATYEPSATVKRYPKPADFKPETTFAPGHPKAGQLRCQAWSSRNGRQCDRSPSREKRVCYSHGGASPAGLAAGQYKHGKYSTAVPQRLIQRYEAGTNDPELLGLRDELAMLDARAGELLGRLDVGDISHTWIGLRDAFQLFQSALKSGNAAQTASSLAEMDIFIRRGYTDYALWSEIINVWDARRKLVETEQKRLERMQQMVTAEQATALINALLLAVRDNVKDRNILSRIQTAFVRLASYGSGESTTRT